ncbi:MAG TPA: universal stress protein, partial [Candidatus Sulfotelmatobacter sp.]|nr:universal stress protein [Candidatus Sulfotelmatobacter sp.]
MLTARLLLCVDGSRASLEAGRAAIDLARQWGSHLRVIYVVENAELDGSPDADLLGQMRESGRAILARIAAMAQR